MAVELCSPEGVRTVLLDEEGRPVAPGHAPACCDLCQGPEAIGAEAPRAPALRVAPVVAAPSQGRARLPPLPARAPPQQPRAPLTA